jgi:type IV pilus assembly protein PilC
MYWLFAVIMPILVFAGFCVLAWKKPGIALILLPFTIVGLLVSGLLYFEGEIVEEGFVIFLLALLLFPSTIVLVRFAPSSGSLETPWYKAFASAVLMIFQYLLILALLTLVFQFFGPLLFILYVVGVVRYKQTRKYSLSMDIISTLGMSMRQSLPLPMALTTAAHAQHGKEAKIFKDIAYWLSEGLPLSEALRRGYPKCPPELTASITAAEKMNQLPKAIETLQADIEEKVNDYKRVRPVHPWYPLIVSIIAFTMIMALAFFIVPTFAEILSDMTEGQAGLPAPTQMLLNFSQWITHGSGLRYLLLFAIIFLIFLVLWERVAFQGRHPDQSFFLSRAVDWLKWHLPVVRGLASLNSQLQLVETLKVGLRSGYPVNITIRNALNLAVNLCYRKRLNRWLEKIEEGHDIAHSASDAKIGRTIAWALDDTVNKGNAPMLLESIEEVYRSRYNYRLNLLNAIACPLMVLGLGIGVGFVVFSMFLPMVKIIQVML